MCRSSRWRLAGRRKFCPCCNAAAGGGRHWPQRRHSWRHSLAKAAECRAHRQNVETTLDTPGQTARATAGTFLHSFRGSGRVSVRTGASVLAVPGLGRRVTLAVLALLAPFDSLHLVRFRGRAHHIVLGFAGGGEAACQCHCQRDRAQSHLVFDYPAPALPATRYLLENCHPLTPVNAGEVARHAAALRKRQNHFKPRVNTDKNKRTYLPLSVFKLGCRFFAALLLIGRRKHCGARHRSHVADLQPHDHALLPRRRREVNELVKRSPERHQAGWAD